MTLRERDHLEVDHKRRVSGLQIYMFAIRPQFTVLHEGIDKQMSKERVTRRQKDVSRLLREKNRLRKSLVKKIKKKAYLKDSDR
jgi:hypothetical protein